MTNDKDIQQATEAEKSPQVKEYIEETAADLDRFVDRFLTDEIDQVAALSILLDGVEEKLRQIYDGKFPKKCNSCQRVYHTRNEYLKATARLRAGDSSFSHSSQRFFEFRNCLCGSTLAIAGEDRRDNSDFGVVRRALFDLCVEKIVKATGQSKEDATDLTREVFRKVIRKAVSLKDE